MKVMARRWEINNKWHESYKEPIPVHKNRKIPSFFFLSFSNFLEEILQSLQRIFEPKGLNKQRAFAKIVSIWLPSIHRPIAEKKNQARLLQTTMASLARSIPQTLRAASRRAPCVLAKSALKPAQSASYSLLARTVQQTCSQHPAVQVWSPPKRDSFKL